MVISAIDAHKDAIIEVGEIIYRNPELGYKEWKTTEAVSKFLKGLHLQVEEHIAVTGCRSRLNQDKTGPCIALLGELDAITVADHPEALPSGAVHACGHNIQIAGLLGAVSGLVASGSLPHLDGSIDVLAVPAEEFIELDFRDKLRESGEITFFGGKQELIYKGYFDHVDISMMFHSLDLGEAKALLSPQSNGFIGKKVTYTGKASHAASAPEEGINALNAAMLGMMNIHAQRETFKEKDRVRVHPIITKGGDIVNVVPQDVRLEACVRARTIDAMIGANNKVHRALQAGAMAVGAEVEISDIPGYLPLVSYQNLDSVFQENLEDLGYSNAIMQGGDFTGSFDFGDLSQIMPAIHPMIGGVQGTIHAKDFCIVDKEVAYILPAKAMALTVVDLLWNKAKLANHILDTTSPPLTKSSYLQLMQKFSQSSMYKHNDE